MSLDGFGFGGGAWIPELDEIIVGGRDDDVING